MKLTPKIQAAFDLIKHYSKVFKIAWGHRKEMEPGKRLSDESEFLPAALSLQETPVSPLPRVAMWLLIIFAVLALLWAIFGSIDIVATAQGKIVPNDRTKTIQPVETSTIKAIYVSDGQLVKAGNLLIELDSTATQADENRIGGDLVSEELQIARGEAMLKAIDTGVPPELKRPEGVDNIKFDEAQNLLLGEFNEYSAKLDRMNAELARNEADYSSTQEEVRKLELTLPIAKQKEQDYKTLYDETFASKHDYLQYKQTRIEQEADLASEKSKLKGMAASVKEAKGQCNELTAETRRIAHDSITDGQQKVAEMEQDFLKADTRNKLMKITSPVDGTVQQLAVHTVGGVVTPAEPLMIIVPQSGQIEVEAFIDNKDIGFVKPGQEAEVKIETFQYTKYGTIHARVESVSHDAINDEKKGLIYSARVKLDKSDINVDGNKVALTPGMAVSVEIKTGRRRVIEYVLSPLIKHTSESLHER
ncbi:MAG: HlyD family type I secretion periplasmic adaptor subunit [Desulfuromonadales bacterium]|nr:HlyD family type I secretion periplasmic adaptor subunit [Desulfuromonadales bacterium]